MLGRVGAYTMTFECHMAGPEGEHNEYTPIAGEYKPSEHAKPQTGYRFRSIGDSFSGWFKEIVARRD